MKVAKRILTAFVVAVLKISSYTKFFPLQTETKDTPFTEKDLDAKKTKFEQQQVELFLTSGNVCSRKR